MQINSWKTILAASALGNAGLLMIYFAPILVGAVDEQLQLTDFQKGLFGASDLIGYAIASLSAYFWIRKVNWRTAALIALVILVVGNMLSMYMPEIYSLVGMRIFTGIGQGIAVALTLAIFGDTDQTDRNLAIYLVLSLLVGIGILPFLPDWVATNGPNPIYWTQMIFAIIAIPFVIWAIPKKGLVQEIKGTTVKLSFPVQLALLGIIILYIGYGGLWVLVERFGDLSGLSAAVIGDSLTISLIVGLVALLLTIFIADRFGRMIPIILSLAFLIIFSLVLFWDQSATGFLIAVCAGNFGINLVIPYMSAVIDQLDESGKGVAMVPAMYSIGLFLGPIVLSFFMSEQDNSMAGYIAAAFFIACLGIYIWLVRKKATD